VGAAAGSPAARKNASAVRPAGVKGTSRRGSLRGDDKSVRHTAGDFGNRPGGSRELLAIDVQKDLAREYVERLFLCLNV
jgi:hypothetical protein